MFVVRCTAIRGPAGADRSRFYSIPETGEPHLDRAIPGQAPPDSLIVDVPSLITAYYSDAPDPEDPAQRVSFGTSGHRGTAFERTFNEAHIIAIVESIRRYREEQGIDGPLFLGIDTHALSVPARATVLEVLAAWEVDVMISHDGDYTPTPVVSHAIVTYNRGRTHGLADGIVITPSHNPPGDGGIKYNPPSGGPAPPEATRWIESRANELLAAGLGGVPRVPLERALRADSTHLHDFASPYVEDLAGVIDLDAIRSAGLSMGVDPLGGAGVHYWPLIADRYRVDLRMVSTEVDPTFRFMSVDTDGQIRMDPSSADAMQRLIGMKDRFDIAFACDTDYDRHGIVTPAGGLMPANNYLSVAVSYLVGHRPEWSDAFGIGKTVVTSAMIDRICAARNRRVFEVPVGFKWFVEGLTRGDLGFVCEESAGATLVRRAGDVWTTDKDGIAAALLSAEIMATTDRDLTEVYETLAEEVGRPVYRRETAPATAEQRRKLRSTTERDVSPTEVGGRRVEAVVSHASGNGASIGGLKIVTAGGWLAVRPSGTEDVVKIYAESFDGEEQADRLIDDGRSLIANIIGSQDASPPAPPP